MAKSMLPGTSRIEIKPSKVGSLRKAVGAKKGQKIPVATLEKEKNSTSPAMRKKATFALNARSWKHK
jgi:hypothetical protein